MRQNKKKIMLLLAFLILFISNISYAVPRPDWYANWQAWEFPETGEVYIAEFIKGGLNSIYKDLYKLPNNSLCNIYGVLENYTIENSPDRYTFTIMEAAHKKSPYMKGRMNPTPGCYLELDKIQRSYYLPYRHDYIYEYDRGRTGRFPIWYMKTGVNVHEIPRDSVKPELYEMRRKLGDIEYLHKKIKKQGQPKKVGDYHPTHSNLLEQYYSDYNKVFWRGANWSLYTSDQITASTEVLDKVIEWIENNKIQPMEILDYRVGDYSGIINKDKRTIDVYLPSDYQIKESDIKIQLPDWIIARKRPGELKVGSFARYFVKPVDALYVNFPQDVPAYDMYEDWTVNFIEIDGDEKVQLNSLFCINPNGKRIYGEITGDKIELNIPNEVKEDEIPVNIYYCGKKLFRVKDGKEEELTNNPLLPLNEDIQLKIAGNSDIEKTFTLSINSEKSDENIITDFYIEGIETAIDNELKTITLYPKYSDDISELVPSIITSYRSTVKPASQIVQNFNETREYIVTSESGKTQAYKIIVERGEASSEKEIKRFRIGTIEGKIEGNIIKIKLPSNINLKEIQPTIEISDKATIVPASGEKVDLSNKELNYVVIAENGSRQEYKLVVEIEEVIDPEIDQELLKELKLIRDNIYKRYKYSDRLTDDWDWMNIGFYEGIDNGVKPDGVRKNPNDLPKGYDMYGQINKLEHFKMTDFDRFIMSATAMGIDASDLSKYAYGDKKFKFKNGEVVDNMIEKIYSKEDVGGINGAAFALIALDMGNYTVPKNARYTRENILKELLEMDLDQKFDVDMVGMVIQSLYPYKDHPIYGHKVKKHLDYGMDLILGQVPAKHVHPMREDYTFESWGTVNSESVAQVICALCSLGIDPHTDYRFSDSEKTLISQWLKMFVTLEKDGFGHTNNSYNHMATYQGMYALQWYINFLENGGAGNPYSLYYDGVPFRFTKEFSKDVGINRFELLGKEGIIDHEAGVITIELPKETSDEELRDQTPIIEIPKGATISPNIGEKQDFTKDVEYTVIAEDGITVKKYTVKIERKQGVESSKKDILGGNIIGFSDAKFEIDNQKGIVNIELPIGTDEEKLKNLKVSFAHQGISISPDETEPQDFTKEPVKYTVTAKDGTTRDYKVSVNIKKADLFWFTKFVLRGVEGEIDRDNREIKMKLPYGVFLKEAKPNEMEYEPITPNTSLSPALSQLSDFSNKNGTKISILPYPNQEDSVIYTLKIEGTSPSGNSKIEKFSVPSSVPGVETNIKGNTIELRLPKGITEDDIKDLVPEIKCNSKTKTIDPEPNKENNSLKDYYKDYVLTDEDGNVNLYTVKIIESNGGGSTGGDGENKNKDEMKIESFKIKGIEGEVDDNTGKIYMEIPYELDLSNISPDIKVSEGSIIYPSLGRPLDLRYNNKFIISNGKETKVYTLILKVLEPKPATKLWYWLDNNGSTYEYQIID